jgi:hypothetical protein
MAPPISPAGARTAIYVSKTTSAYVPFGIQPSTGLADVLGARSVRGDSSAHRQLCGIDGRLWRPTLTVANTRYRHIPNDMRDEP